MKKFLIFLLCCFILIIQSGMVFAYELKIPAGTPVSIYTPDEIDADDVKLGKNVDFIVQEGVSINNHVVISAGSHVIGQITKKKNNFILGIPGSIEVGNFRVKTIDNKFVNLRGLVQDKGTGREWANIGWFFLFPVLFIKGDDGKIPAGMYQIVYTIGETYVTIGK